jgi:hypothetical protein
MWPTLSVLAPAECGSFSYNSWEFFFKSLCMAMRLFSSHLSQGDSMSLYIYGGKKIISASHPIHWKSTENSLFNHLSYSSGNTKHISCEVLPHKTLGSHVAFLSTKEQFSFPFCFFVHKTFVSVHCVSMSASMIVAFVLTINLKESLKQHGKVLESWISP